MRFRHGDISIDSRSQVFHTRHQMGRGYATVIIYNEYTITMCSMRVDRIRNCSRVRKLLFCSVCSKAWRGTDAFA